MHGNEGIWARQLELANPGILRKSVRREAYSRCLARVWLLSNHVTNMESEDLAIRNLPGSEILPSTREV